MRQHNLLRRPPPRLSSSRQHKPPTHRPTMESAADGTSAAGSDDHTHHPAHHHERSQRRLHGHRQARPPRDRSEARAIFESSTTTSRRRRSAASHAETNLPLQVGLLIDASNSVRDRFKFEQESAIEFLNQTIHPQHTTGIRGRLRRDSGSHAGFHRQHRVLGPRSSRTASRRRHRAVRRAVFRLPRQVAEGAEASTRCAAPSFC